MVPFRYGPILPQRSHFTVELWWATGPTLPRYWANFTPNYGVMMSHWILSVLFELIIVNWNPFQRLFSEVAPVSWHINFISSSYNWGVRVRFVTFGCSLPPFLHQPPLPFQGYPPFLAKFLVHPRWLNFLKILPHLPLIKVGRVPTMLTMFFFIYFYCNLVCELQKLISILKWLSLYKRRKSSLRGICATPH